MGSSRHRGQREEQDSGSRVPRRVALAGGLGGIALLGVVAAEREAGASDTPATVGPDWTNVTGYGAKGDGATDDTAALQAALDATRPGGVTYLPVGVYAISAPLVIPPAVTLLGSHANRLSGSTYVTPLAYITALAGFAGTAMIRLLDRQEGGYALDNGGQRIVNVCLEGSVAKAAGVTGVAGVLATGLVHDVVLDGVCIQNVPGDGVATASYVRSDGNQPHPYTWSLRNTTVSHAGGHGFSIMYATDSTLVNCETIGSGGHGFCLNGSLANTNLTSCRAEWSTGHGFYITGNWWTGQGSGGMNLVGCSTDRNNLHGVYIDSQGNGPMLLSGLMMRRDGRNGYPGAGGGGYAGLAAVGARTPIVISGFTCYPGVGDDGQGVNSPQYGMYFASNTFVSVGGAGYLHAASEALHDGGTNAALLVGTGIGVATGTTGAPVHGTPI